MITIKSIYQIEKLIVESILSKIYLGRSIKHEQNVCIVEYKSEFIRSSIVSELIKESETLLGLDHPNLLKMMDYHYDGTSFYVMYRFEHNLMSLDVCLGGGQRWDQSRVHSILSQVLDVLLYFEEHGISYATLNLEAIYLTKDEHVQLCSPRLSAIIIRENWRSLTLVEECIFLPPEFLFSNELSSQGDVYSFGILMYFLYTGKWPYQANSNIESVKKELLKKPKSPHKYFDTLSDDLEQMIMMCIKRDSASRFNSVKELYDIFHGKKTTMFFSNAKVLVNTDSDIQENLEKNFKKGQGIQFRNVIKDIVLMGLPFILLISGYLGYLIYTSNASSVRVPDLIGMSVEDSRYRLSKQKLSMKVVGERYHPLIPEGHIIESKPSARREVKENRLIRLFVSKGSRSVKASNYIGQTVDQVLSVLESDQVSVDIVSEKYSLYYPSGQVVFQVPTPNSMIELEESLDLTLSKGFPVILNIMPTIFDSQQDRQKNVTLSFWIPNYWKSQFVRLVSIVDGQSYPLFSYYYYPEEQETVTFRLPESSYIELYFGDVLTVKKQI